MDAALLDQLETEHRQVEDIFAKLERAENEGQQRPLVEQLVTALTRHMEIEETEVYPEVAKLDAEMEQEAENEHQLGRDGLATLQSMVGQPGFGAAVEMLKAGIGHHVEEEEGEVFPALREALGCPAGDSSKRDLYKRAQAAGIEGRSTMSKDELAEAVQQS
jgi:hemerythrin superfamily protein